MAKEFQETVNRLARARNFEGGAYCLITAITGEDTHHIDIHGVNNGILCGINSVLNRCLKLMPDNAAKLFREDIKQTLIEDEQRRFQCGAEQEE